MTDELARYFTDAEDPGFLAFMRRADKVVAKVSGGLGVLDFADAAWMDLYTDTRGQAEDEDILDTLAEADDIFARMRGLGADGDA